MKYNPLVKAVRATIMRLAGIVGIHAEAIDYPKRNDIKVEGLSIDGVDTPILARSNSFKGLYSAIENKSMVVISDGYHQPLIVFTASRALGLLAIAMKVTAKLGKNHVKAKKEN